MTFKKTVVTTGITTAVTTGVAALAFTLATPIGTMSTAAKTPEGYTTDLEVRGFPAAYSNSNSEVPRSMIQDIDLARLKHGKEWSVYGGQAGCTKRATVAMNSSDGADGRIDTAGHWQDLVLKEPHLGVTTQVKNGKTNVSYYSCPGIDPQITPSTPVNSAAKLRDLNGDRGVPFGPNLTPAVNPKDVGSAVTPKPIAPKPVASTPPPPPVVPAKPTPTSSDTKESKRNEPSSKPTSSESQEPTETPSTKRRVPTHRATPSQTATQTTDKPDNSQNMAYSGSVQIVTPRDQGANPPAQQPPAPPQAPVQQPPAPPQAPVQQPPAPPQTTASQPPAPQDQNGQTVVTRLASAPQSGSGQATQTQPSASDGTDPAITAAIVGLVNQERTQRGLGPVRDRGELNTCASNWSGQMVATGVFKHSTTDSQRSCFKNIPTGWGWVGENIADTGNSLPANSSAIDIATKLMTMWMNSPEHKANILEPRANTIGIGAVARDGRYYGTQVFAQY